MRITYLVGTTTISAPSLATPCSTPPEAPVMRYWAEKILAAIKAKQKIVARLRPGLFLIPAVI
jgi:hypothetical protein